MTSHPVIVGIGQSVVRDHGDAAAAEPLQLILSAARAAGDDAEGRVLEEVDDIELVSVVSWPYDDLPGRVAQALPLRRPPRAARMGPHGGEQPVKLLDEAAARIARGEARVVLIAGGEGLGAAQHAARRGGATGWPPAARARRDRRESVPATIIDAGLPLPVHVYPLYENALRAHDGLDLASAQAETAHLWAQLSQVAAANPFAWIREQTPAEKIVTAAPGNRPICFPYTKLTVANNTVNQGAAVLVTDTRTAAELGVPRERWVFPWGGCGADDDPDPLARPAYHRSPAMEATLAGVQARTATSAADWDHVELYSCFPCVPKMAQRLLGTHGGVVPTVTGGLTFFGGPGNNYMTHAIAAMTSRLRERGGAGLLYGQGGFVTKHHALVLAASPPPDGYLDGGSGAPRSRTPPPEPVPLYTPEFVGAGTVETFTVVFDRAGEPEYGAVIGTGRFGHRFAARVEPSDAITIEALLGDTSVVGATGSVSLWHDVCRFHL